MKTMQEIDTIYRAEKQQAKLSGAWEIIFRQLTRRIGPLSNDLEQGVKSLSLEDVNLLGEDLLDFSQTEDLISWLDRHQD